MKPSVIVYESELTALIQRYLDRQVSFEELVHWVDHHELSWAEFDFGSVAEGLSGLVMSLYWEMQDGAYDEQARRDTLSSEFAEIVGSRAGR
jgi:hypothetical protein